MALVPRLTRSLLSPLAQRFQVVAGSINDQGNGAPYVTGGYVNWQPISKAPGLALGSAWQRHMACSAGLGRAPPKVITIEYDPADLETYIKVADAIEEAFPTVIVQGNEETDGRPGSFEVQTEDGVPVYSRLTSSHVPLPTPADVLNRIIHRANLSAGAVDVANQPFCQ